MTYTDYQHQCLEEEIQEIKKELEVLKNDTQLIKDRLQGYNYCPDCGAKMVEPQESEVEE